MEIRKRTLVYIGIALILILILLAGIRFTSFSILNSKENNNTGISEQLAKCIGKNSVYYSQTGCSACKIQEDMFEENVQYLNKIDCRLDMQKCIDAGIETTPTWIINNQVYPRVQTIERLAELTGC